MKLFKILATFPAVYSLAITNTEGEAPHGYGIDVPEWDVEVTPGGERITLNGTVEEVRRELLTLNPRWEEDFAFTVSGKDAAESDDDDGLLVKRTDFYGAKYVCRKWSNARYKPISNGIKYLRGVSGRPVAGPGPGNCARVSCSYDSAIWWCNDAKESKTLNSFGSIADGAQYVLNNCVLPSTGGTYPPVNGQVFHKTHWNVIVRGASC
ncbi:uncharacterized protein BDV14DRAFT_99136 [Aspergillus stella-maris]|uniref:uncharacterized protein n=1 Tax=Aspergillus stella-maris TaxID=1810926 RepID=UPI003CCDF0C4